jgi:hypothetical protein
MRFKAGAARACGMQAEIEEQNDDHQGKEQCAQAPAA